MTPASVSDRVGVILAGGASRRMGGGDKGLLKLAGRPLLAHVAERLGPQVGSLILNANGDPARFDGLGLPVLSDRLGGQRGPLAGLLSGLYWMAEHHPGARWLATVPGDAPLLPGDLVDRLVAAAEAAGVPAACVASNGRRHPVVGVWRAGLRDDLERFILQEEGRRAAIWAARCEAVTVNYGDAAPDPFFNVNSPEDLARAEELLVSFPA